MLKCIYHICLVLIMFCASAVQAQEDTMAMPQVVMNAEGHDSVFDSIKPADATPVVSRIADRKAVEKMRNDDDFWYYNTAPATKKEVPKKKVKKFSADWSALPYILWTIVIGGFIAFLIWFLYTTNVQLFRKAPKQRHQAGKLVEEENIFEINYNLQIQSAISAGDYRMAVRLLYLQLLTQLSERGLVTYKQTFSNSDYVMQLYGSTYYNDFALLTRHFEYTWYGQFSLSSASFAVVQNDFNAFNKQLQS